MQAEIGVQAEWTSHLEQFSERLHVAADRTIVAATQRGSFLSQVLAPKKTLKLAATIKPGLYGPGVGAWSVGPLKYALAQEKGAVPHEIGIDGQVLANKAEGFGPVVGPVQHPGNKGIHFLLRAYETIKGELLRDLTRNFE